MKQYVEIKGRTFEKVQEPPINVYFYSTFNTRTLSDCYGKCSTKKKAIYEDWKKYFNQFEKCRFGVRSHTVQFFTLNALCFDNGKWYYFSINPVNHYVSEVTVVE